MHVTRAMAAKVAAPLVGQINPCVRGSRLCNAAQAHKWSGGRRASFWRRAAWWTMGPFMLYARGERLGRQITLADSWRSSSGV